MPKKKPKREPTPELDPILPLPAGTGIPPLKQGEGNIILNSTEEKVVVLPYRAFYQMWEHAEAVAQRQYQKYVGTPLDHAAQAALEAVVAFRNSALGVELPVVSEKKARILRQRFADEAKAAKKDAVKRRALERDGASPDTSETPCSHERVSKKKSKKTGEKYLLCLLCKEKLPLRAATKPSKGSRAPKTGAKSPKSATKSQKRTQKPKNRKV